MRCYGIWILFRIMVCSTVAFHSALVPSLSLLPISFQSSCCQFVHLSFILVAHFPLMSAVSLSVCLLCWLSSVSYSQLVLCVPLSLSFSSCSCFLSGFLYSWFNQFRICFHSGLFYQLRNKAHFFCAGLQLGPSLNCILRQHSFLDNEMNSDW